MDFGLVTDSTCDMQPAEAHKLGINLVPLRVRVGDEGFLDWVEIDPDRVYQQQRDGATISTTPPSQQRFEDMYSRLLKQHDFIVSTHISSQLSDTVQHARKAAMALKASHRILVIDSGLASVALAESVLIIRHILQAGGDADAAQLAAQWVRHEIYSQFTMPTLEYLRRNGRISRSQEVMGNMLNMRPVMGFDNGRIKVIRRAKSNEALEDIIEHIRQKFGDQPLSIAIGHGGRDPERLAELSSAVDNSGLNIKFRRKQIIGAVIGTHVGPGFYGISATPLVPTDELLAPRKTARTPHIGRHSR